MKSIGKHRIHASKSAWLLSMPRKNRMQRVQRVIPHISLNIAVRTAASRTATGANHANYNIQTAVEDNQAQRGSSTGKPQLFKPAKRALTSIAGIGGHGDKRHVIAGAQSKEYSANSAECGQTTGYAEE